MKKIDVGQTISILANVGVLVGILLLVYELSLNRQMVEAQTRHEVSQGIADQFFDIASNVDLAQLLNKGRSGALESEVEQLRYEAWIVGRLRYWEDVHYQYRIGLYDETEFAGQKEAWRAVLQIGPIQEFWSNVKSRYSPEFAAEIDELLAD